MKYNELMEGSTPKLPGATKGVEIMTPQQFVSKTDEENLDENLRKWFKEKWVRFGPDGKIRGDCARGDDSEGKPKCLPQSKAHSLGKKGRASAAARKRREDPNPERSGPAINVATKRKSNEDIAEGLARNEQEKKLYKLLEAWGFWISFKTSHIGKEGIDAQAQNELSAMQRQYLGPVLNGIKWNDITKGDLWQNPKVIPHLLKYIYQAIPYVESRVTKFVKPELQKQYLDYINNHLKPMYKEVVTQYSNKQGMSEEQLDEKCWDTHKQVGMKSKGGKMVPNCVPKESIEEGHQQCPECGGPSYSNLMLAEKKDACYYKVKSRYKVWPSAYASGALVKCRKKGANNWGTKSESVDEATKLPAQTRELKGKELEDYLDRIRGQEKLKTDKYKLPYIHRSSVIGYYNEEGKKYNVDAIKAALAERPKKLLKQNEKMKHSNGETEQFFNIGFSALIGIALDETTNELIVVNTCPGAGSCKVDCFAMKGGKIQFAGPWLSDGRILTYLLNDPQGFFKQLDSEIKKEEQKGDKGGYTVTIRWHDAGDFFSPEYTDMAFELAKNNSDVMFYAYTKVADVVLAKKPANFMINWSEGAHTSQEKKVKAKDPNLDITKNSRIVPSNLFYDLLVKDEKKNLVKGPEGQWQVIPEKLPELKQRLAKQYGISANSILSYKEWETKGKKNPQMKWNVIITPGEPDLTAKDPSVLSTLLLKH